MSGEAPATDGQSTSPRHLSLTNDWPESDIGTASRFVQEPRAVAKAFSVLSWNVEHTLIVVLVDREGVVRLYNPGR